MNSTDYALYVASINNRIGSKRTVVAYLNIISKNMPVGNKETNGVLSKDKKTQGKSMESME